MKKALFIIWISIGLTSCYQEDDNYQDIVHFSNSQNQLFYNKSGDESKDSINAPIPHQDQEEEENHPPKDSGGNGGKSTPIDSIKIN